MYNCTLLESRGSRKTGSTFLSRKRQRTPCCSVGFRARELPSRGRHTVGRTRRVAASGQPLLGALHCGRSYTRVVRTALPAPAPTQPPQTKAQGHLRLRASVARGVSSLADFSPGATRGRENVPSPSPPTEIPVPDPSSQELLDTTMGAHPGAMWLWKEVEKTGDSEIGGKEVGTPACSNWGGLGKWSQAGE